MSAIRNACIVARALFLLGAIAFPAAARAEALHADLDGDGVRDRIDLAFRLTELDVRLSDSRATQRLTLDDVILRVVVADIDRDGDPDLLARTRQTGLQIWINTGHGYFARQSSKSPALRGGRANSITAVSARQDDDRAWNDPTRELVSSCSPRGQPFAVSFDAAAPPGAREFRFQHSPQIARGPPSASIH